MLLKTQQSYRVLYLFKTGTIELGDEVKSLGELERGILVRPRGALYAVRLRDDGRRLEWLDGYRWRPVVTPSGRPSRNPIDVPTPLLADLDLEQLRRSRRAA